MKRIDKIIDVIYTTDNAGLLKPVYFYLDDNEDFEPYVIERLIRRDAEKINGEKIITFTCEIIRNNMRSLYDLRFNETTKKWMLYRM